MGGWFVDVFVGYLITLGRILARRRRTQRIRDWPKVSAIVSGASCQSQAYMPRPIAEIVYTYHFDGSFYGGVDEKPFLLESSANACAGEFHRGDTLIIRVKPGEPETSLVRDEDQIASE
jgi:hypothetical protein